MAFIEFNWWSNYLIYPFLMPIFLTLRTETNLRRDKLDEKAVYDENTSDFWSPFFFSLLSVLVYLCSGFLELISINLRRKTNQKPENEPTSIDKLPKILIIPYTDTETKHSLKKYYSLLITSSIILCFLFTLSILLTHKAKFHYTQLRVSVIIFDLILSKLILKYQVFRHQLMSIIFMIGGLIMVSYQVIDKSLVDFFLSIANYILYSILDIEVKILSNDRRNSLFMIIFLQGLISTVIYLFILSFIWAVPCTRDPNSFFPCTEGYIENIAVTLPRFFNSNAEKKALFIICSFITHSAYTFCLFKTLFHFTPLHRCMSDSMSTMFLWIIESLVVAEFKVNLMEIIGYVIIVLSSMIYNEIVILNFCELSYYTKREISKRGMKDIRLVQMDQIEEDNINEIMIMEN